MGSKGGKGGGGKIPKPPGVAKTYQKGIDVYLKNEPRIDSAENAARALNDPIRIQHQQDLQDKFGPHQYDEQRDALSRLDPQWMKNHAAVGDAVFNDLKAGYGLTPGLENQVEQNVRGSQAARGNILGDAAGNAEAYALGDRGVQLYQQRLGNAQGYLNGQNVVNELQGVQPVSADRSDAYVDPNAGWQGVNAANARYQGLVGASSANQQAASAKGGQTTSLITGIAGAAAIAL